MLAFLHNSVAAAGQKALIGAAIVIDAIAVIAAFDTGADDAVAALRQSAAIGTTIVVDSIAIVAVLVSVVLWLKVLSNHPIPAASFRTVGKTSVFIETIAIVTLLTLVNDPIATARWATIVATVRRVFVAIVATLSWAGNAVAADVTAAVALAGIFVDLIAIITDLVTGLTGLKSFPQDPVTAGRYNAVVPAAISVVLVAVITGFSSLHNAIAATGFGAGVAATIVVHRVAVIASLYAETHDSIATSGWNATGHAVIIIRRVAIVALFKAKFTFP